MTADWSSGYVTDIEYTYGYYPELAPVLLNYIAVLGGHKPRPIEGEFSYCELGCGNGVSTNVMAACYPRGSFYGVDFNPNHIANANEVASAGGLSNVKFLERSFSDLMAEDLPEFDFIGLHGVYSWISAENRRSIVDIIRTRLKPGGIVYISYNTLPGWATIEPLRRLLVEYTGTLSGDMASKIKTTLDHAGQLAERGARFFDQGGRVKAMLDRLQKATPAYIAHEYLNKDWSLLYFTDVAREMAGAKLTFAGSANAVKNHLQFLLSQQQREIIASVSDPMLRELEKDFLINEQFRRDVYVKAMPTVGGPTLQTLAQIRVGSFVGERDIQREISIPAGTMKLQHPMHDKLIALVAEAPRTLAELLQHPDLKGLEPAEIIHVVNALVAGDQFKPFARANAAPTGKIDGAVDVPSAFNRAILASLFGNPKVRVLASPVAGMGVTLSGLDGLVLASIAAVGVADAANGIWRELARRGRRLVKDGKPVEDEAENKKMLVEGVEQFRQTKLDRFVQLGIITPK